MQRRAQESETDRNLTALLAQNFADQSPALHRRRGREVESILRIFGEVARDATIVRAVVVCWKEGRVFFKDLVDVSNVRQVITDNNRLGESGSETVNRACKVIRRINLALSRAAGRGFGAAAAVLVGCVGIIFAFAICADTFTRR